MFDWNEAPFLGPGELQLDMAYVSCPAERAFNASMSTLVVLLGEDCSLSDQVHVHTIIDWSYHVSLLLENLSL